MPNDIELLREYAEHGSEEAFRTLVERHSGMVHGVALRTAHQEHLAEEITQAVFIILARKATKLSARTVVAGWLYQTARFVALEAVRAERRRRERDERMRELEDSNRQPSEPAAWDQIAPRLDEALSGLGQTEREAIVLRFLQQRSFAEVASTLRTSEAAAKMRVGRALEKLRATLGHCGVVVSTATLLAALTAHGATPAPLALITGTTASALAQSGTVQSSITSLVKGAMILMAWNKAKLGVTAVVLVLLLGGGGVAVWKWQPHRAETPTHLLTLRTFEPMAGEWEGTFKLTRDGSVLVDNQPCSMSVTTRQDGRACEIEMRTRMAAGAPSMIQHYSHTLNERGDRLFTTSDPASGRGDGEGEVTESFHNPAASEWRAAMRFPLPRGRGVMEGSWARHGDALVVRSHDEFFSEDGSSHVHAELQLRRRLGANRTP